MAKTREFTVSFGTKKKKYGFFHFLWDLFLIAITGGLWLVWLIIRYLRKN